MKMISMLSYKTWTWSMLRSPLVFLTLGVVTWSYYSFSHFVHQTHHFKPPHDSPNEHNEDGHDHQHGRGGSFDNFHLKKDGLFLYGFALPLLFLTLASLVWNPSTSTKGTITKDTHNSTKENSRGDVNVKKWTIVCFVLPLFLVMLDGARSHDIFHSKSQEEQMGWNLYVRICMSLMSPSGYAATWALALFLIPVTKHSPILDWLCVTPIQALAFHRVAGWTSFWNSVLHGFLHLRHLMDVLNPQRSRAWYQQLKILLIPSSWKCIGTQNPWQVFFGRQDPLDGTNEEANQCWLALVNLTGMISVLAFVLLAITSLPQVRRYSYALFYSVHIPSAWIMLIMAIWHYPTCALVLIPNIIYYISFNIPIYVTQNMDKWSLQCRSKKSEETINNSPLVEANLIQGGSIELIFAATPRDYLRHESRFARILCPAVSPLSHPFSIFSHHDLLQAEVDNAMNADNSSPATISILLRPTGPFTKRLTKVLFETDTEESTDDVEDQFDSISRPLVAPPSRCMMQVDSYYAGSFNWIDRAMKSHDEILLVAGGVGIVPFLEFLPSLQQRIKIDTASIRSTCGSLVDGDTLLESNNILCGPSRIHVHWYCREIGLASYIWNNYLSHHVEEAWEANLACQGRLKIHLHLTSLTPTSSSGTRGSEEILRSTHNAGLVKKQTYSADIQQDAFRPVQDASFTQIWWLRVFFPGILMIAGTILHWWWYKQFVIDEKFRHDNLVIRSHSIVFALALAIVVSILVEKYLRNKHDKISQAQYTSVAAEDSGTELSSQGETVSATPTQANIEIQHRNNTDNPMSFQETATSGGTSIDTLLTVTGGRPSIDSVIHNILQSDRPGVYSCGPRPLMESLERAIRNKRTDCAFYQEDSEM
jgi:hypothetical protein